MGLKIIEKQPTVCLNMIVKNESHIIRETLEMLCSKINFSYWVICDTGSTDNTKDIIYNFFKEKQIEGKIYDHQWKNFAYNRTLALESAFNKSDLLFIFDADDEIHGKIDIPLIVDNDGYLLNFGTSQGISYQRILLVNNRIKWLYKSIIHECINCLKPDAKIVTLKGDYYIVSGRSGNRNNDPNKYLKDAKILEEAYHEAKLNNDNLYLRYGFYCANSYKDAGMLEESIKWYKITLNNDNWVQEKYMCCLNLYNQYNSIGEKEKALYYLVESFRYDTERMECVYYLISHYLLSNLHYLAYNYYSLIKDFYENRYLNSDNEGKLFVEVDKANFLLPYYMILLSDKVKETIPEAKQTIIKMYQIVFTKKYNSNDEFFVGNLLYNLQFFIELCMTSDGFKELFQSYIDFLQNKVKYNLVKHDFLKVFTKYGINFECFNINKSNFTLEDCKQSNKILFYTGFANLNWNYSFSLNNALGGSETAVICLARSFPKNIEIYIGGSVQEEKIENITFVNLHNLKKLIKSNPFHTVIISRYIAFYEMFPETSFYQSFIWGHDISLYPYGCDLDLNSILNKWNSKITKCICQTDWHRNLFAEQYPQIKDKLTSINNGIEIDKFELKSIKFTNRFIYTSCAERGLERLLELWPQIIENLPDAELFIASYNKFPQNDFERQLQTTINKFDNIKHMGTLNKDKLYQLMSTAEFWLYPTNFTETSCITSMEMLMSEVICIYYPIAGLVNTLGNYGIPIQRGNEIDTILNLSIKQKCELKKKGKEYALSCSWNNRFKNWSSIIYSTDTENFIIKIINLEKRNDRRDEMTSKLTKENIKNYEFFKAVDGKELEQKQVLYELFKHNDFGYKKGVIGCALSHIHLWNELLHDKNNEFYVILEDDVNICSNFKQHLNYVSNLFVSQNIEHLALGEYYSNKDYPINSNDINTYKKNLYEERHIIFGYLISKNAVIKAFDYINSCSIKCAFDNPLAFGYILDYRTLSHKLIECKIDNQYGSDIQNNNLDNYFTFDDNNSNISSLTVAYCDWWESEYCGGTFDVHNNFFTNLIKTYNCCNLDVKIVNPNDNPDILFYSIFGSSHKLLKAKRKVFFSGEPYGQDADANFNITFDPNSLYNTRLPLWVCYFDENIYHESNRRLQKIYNIHPKEKFCSFIASGPGLTNNCKEFVEKLSKYKTVDCGGAYLNNIGEPVPIGINCSEKVEHNKKYKFAMAFESKYYLGYVTEKICDIFKSNTIPIYWGTSEVVKDFNPKTFINANDFSNFDELVEYVKKVDNDDNLYNSYFKEPILSNMWMDIYTDRNCVYFKNLVDKIIGTSHKLLDNYFNSHDAIKFYSGNKQDEFISNCIFTPLKI